MNWDADFAGLPPIKLPDGRQLETLADLRAYIMPLPKRDRLAWNDAVAVSKAAEPGHPVRRSVFGVVVGPTIDVLQHGLECRDV
jgi:hypothetical protein